MKLNHATTAQVRAMTDTQLYDIVNHEQALWTTETRDRVDAEVERRRSVHDRKRLADLVTDFISDLDANGETEIEFGWGVNHRVLTVDDLDRIAELLDQATLREAYLEGYADWNGGPRPSSTPYDTDDQEG